MIELSQYPQTSLFRIKYATTSGMGAFGAAFGPVILLSLYWRRLNYKGAIAGIITGFVVDMLWMILLNFEYCDRMGQSLARWA